MRAQLVTALDGPSALRLTEVDAPCAEGSVIIDVAAAGVSFPDLLLSQGRYQVKPQLPFIPGLEVAGTVRSAPLGCGLEPGDRVAACTMLGGFAEVVAAPPETTFSLHRDLSFAEGAGLIVNYHTAHFALAQRAGLRPTETVTVHGAGGGVGTAAVQVAKALGARVLAVTSSAEKATAARRAGADAVIDAQSDWAAAVRQHTAGRGADVILDPVGGDRFDQSLRCLAPEGRLLVVGFSEGRIPTVAANRLLLRNVSVVGVAWGAFLAEQPALGRQTAAALDRMIGAGGVRPIIGTELALEQAPDALRLLESRRAVGKVVLRVT